VPTSSQTDERTYRVEVSDRQAVVGFPKLGRIAIGFADEILSCNVPHTCDAELIYELIEHNKGDGASREDCLAAIRTVQDAAKALLGGDAR
jgi:hypothetical protein